MLTITTTTAILDDAPQVESWSISSDGRVLVWLAFRDATATTWQDGSAVTLSRLEAPGPLNCYVLNCPYDSMEATPASCTWETLSACLTLNLFVCELPGVYEGGSGRTA